MVEACKKGLNKSYYQEVLDDTDWVQIAALDNLGGDINEDDLITPIPDDL